MTTYTIQAPDGKEYSIDGPEGASREQIIAKIKERQGGKTDLPPSEPSTITNLLGGATSYVKGAEQLLPQLTPSDAKPKERPAPGKVPSAEADPSSAMYAAGQMIPAMGAAAVLDTVAPEFSPAIAGGLTGLLSPVEDPTEDFAGKKVAQTVEGLGLGWGLQFGGKAASAGVTALGDWLVRRSPENIDNAAINTILKRINTSNRYGAPSATDMLNLMASTNKPLTLADIGDKSLKSLGGRVLRTPGDAATRADTFLTNRDNAAAQRLEADIAKHVYSGDTMKQTLDGQLKARSAAARPAYAEADALQGIWSPRLQEFLDNPEFKAGMAKGYQIERLFSLAEGRPFDATMLGVDLDDQGHIKILRTPNMRVLDMAKQGLDAMVAEQRDPLTGRLSAKGLALQRANQAYVKLLDELDTSGAYKRAREIWQGPSKAMDAVRIGNSVFANTPEENAEFVKNATDGERQFMILGMADKLRERLTKARFNSDESKALLNSPYAVQQIKPFFKSTDDFNKFVDAVTNERLMAESFTKMAKGSQTAERRMEDTADTSESALATGAKMLKKAMIGDFFHIAAEGWRIARDAKSKPDPELDSAIAKILFAPDIFQTDLGKRLAQGMQPIRGNKLIDFAKMLKATSGSPITAAGATSGLQSGQNALLGNGQ